ncbi:VCBS domain-containing protein, partial [uncultured Psychromonas sp.]|uniref:VCBS domain-containing protein n=1 Tax=uncultured Psychromonas sp. TaxID=173974 RepID=UPI00261888C9
SFTYTNEDGSTETVSVTVEAISDDTVVAADAATTNEDTPITIDVLANDTDVDSDISPVSTVTQGVNGSVAINEDGTVTYTPNVDFNGTDIFTYTNEEGNTETVNVTVTPVNDISVVSGNSESEVTEDEATTLTVSGSLVVTDVDNETTFTPATVTGTYGDITIDENGEWTYAADNTQAAIQALDEGETLTDTITVTTSDGVEQTIEITINGVDDLSVVTGDDTGAVTEDADAATLSTTGTLSLSDVDTTDTTTFTPATVTGAYGAVSIAADGSWTYEADNTQVAIQALDDGESLTDTITVTTSDGVEQAIVITINGVDDLSVVTGDDTGAVTEDADATTLSTTGTLSLSDVDTTDTTTFTAESITGDYGTVTIDENGEWTYAADNTQAAIQALDDGET